MKVKYFTPQEANRRLPYIRVIVHDLLSKGKNLQAITLLPHQIPEIQEQREILQTQIEKLMAELEELGCYYKDWNFEIGLVDFPAIIDNKQVLLCWRSDEPGVTWYHGYEDGYVGRRPIPEELL
jgi:hypothetical protein